MLFSPLPNWKSGAAHMLHRIGRGGDAKALYGLDNPQQPVAERPASEWREEAERRLRATSHPPNRSFCGCCESYWGADPSVLFPIA